MAASQRADYYAYVANQGCLVCGTTPVEVAHLRVMASRKTGDLMARRRGLAAWAVIPLCAKHHRTSATSIHDIGEGDFEQRNGWASGYLAGTALRLLAEWIEEAG